MARTLTRLSGRHQLDQDDVAILTMLDQHQPLAIWFGNLIGPAEGGSPMLPVQRLRDYRLLGLIALELASPGPGCLGAYALTERGKREIRRSVVS